MRIIFGDFLPTWNYRVVPFYIDAVHPAGKPRLLYLLSCRGFWVEDYSFTLGRVLQCNIDPVIEGFWSILDTAQLGEQYPSEPNL
jgi:hypothetical protein